MESGPEAGCLARVPGAGERRQDRVGVVERRRHERVGLAAGIAEHDALVARALVLVAGLVDAERDVGGLRVNVDLDGGLGPVEAVLLVADLAHAVPRDGRERLGGDRLRSPYLARQHDPVGGDQGLAGHAGVGIERQIGIDHGIGDSVADLVRVPFRHRFAGEQVFPSAHGFPQSWQYCGGGRRPAAPPGGFRSVLQGGQARAMTPASHPG